ncbi:hypothetical protein K6119_14475 [Paracrocinitomix mangrovi]|uniref:hypothetical protein n=1 Tax=Paracrocinitomix mangrovi TaxID=2862509 RepID=UPI001C8ED147|nr:hypothetical protein [Paracrocinitomix mangrovi]UKN00937.1 hypothetical protein K6119_14475 [Paracrocinitomix mangrovi]
MHFESEDQAINYYSDKKTSGEMDLSQIRTELKDTAQFSEEDIKVICQKISDREFHKLTSEKKPLFHFFDHIIFTWLFLGMNISIIAFSIIYLIRVYDKDPNLDTGSAIHVYPYLFIGGATVLMSKHIKGLRKHYRKKN